MNREQRRAAEAKQKMQANAERVKAVVEASHTVADAAERFKMMLFSLARQHGRIRVRADDLRALGENDRIDFLHQDNGDVIVQYTAGGAA